MIQITKQATDHLLELRTRRGLDGGVGVRFVRSGGHLGLVFARDPETGDVQVPSDAVPIYVSSELAEAFERSTIDTRTEDERTRLVLRRSQPARA